ncbi:TPA: hypothetical protein IG238_001643 [Escherichia coli]|nr:hypothetical protein [Escherichia coli]
MKSAVKVVIGIVTLGIIPMLTDSGKEWVYGFVNQHIHVLVAYWREILITVQMLTIIFLLMKLIASKSKFKMKFEQLWDGDGTLYCKTCKTPVDRDLDSLWCPSCKKEIELFDGQRKITLHEAKNRLR